MQCLASLPPYTTWHPVQPFLGVRHLNRWLAQRSQRTGDTWSGFQELIE